MHRSPTLLLPVLAAVAIGGCHPGERRSDDAFAWSGMIPAGQALHVNNLRGDITVVPALGEQVLIAAEKHWRGRRPERVRLVTRREHDGAVAVCALWNDGRCSTHAYRAGSSKRFFDRLIGRGETRVEFTVALPAGVHLVVRTTNGDVEVAGADAPLTIRSVNGDIEARTRVGPLQAETVNGSIEVRVDSLPPDADLQVETVNGSLVAILPETLHGRLEASTVNGSIDSDFPLEFGGGRVGRKAHASFGGPGRLSFTTVNGRIALRRGT